MLFRSRARKQTPRNAPQLVMMSATLRNHLRRFLLADSGWFTKGPGSVVKITGDPSAYYPKEGKETATEDKAEHTIGGTNVQHHVLVIDKWGRAVNIPGAVSAGSGQENSASAESQTERTPENTSREAISSGGTPGKCHDLGIGSERLD